MFRKPSCVEHVPGAPVQPRGDKRAKLLEMKSRKQDQQRNRQNASRVGQETRKGVLGSCSRQKLPCAGRSACRRCAVDGCRKGPKSTSSGKCLSTCLSGPSCLSGLTEWNRARLSRIWPPRRRWQCYRLLSNSVQRRMQCDGGWWEDDGVTLT